MTTTTTTTTTHTHSTADHRKTSLAFVFSSICNQVNLAWSQNQKKREKAEWLVFHLFDFSLSVLLYWFHWICLCSLSHIKFFRAIIYYNLNSTFLRQKNNFNFCHCQIVVSFTSLFSLLVCKTWWIFLIEKVLMI